MKKDNGPASRGGSTGADPRDPDAARQGEVVLGDRRSRWLFVSAIVAAVIVGLIIAAIWWT